MNARPLCGRRIRARALGIAAAVGIAVAAAGCAPPGQEIEALRTKVAELEGALGRLADIEAQLAELRAQQEIRALFADYGRTLDERDFAAFGRLFARDAEFVGGGNTGVARGPDAIAAMLQNAIAQNAKGANLHIYSNDKIIVNGDRATATSRGAFVGEDETGAPRLLIYATYEDELVREEGRWKFQRRRIIGDIPGPPNESR